jgi:putative nucleotidyltransferase with HDIG domain
MARTADSTALDESVEAVGLDGVLKRVDNLPTLPHVALQVGELVNDPGADARQVASVMRGDPSLTAKVLRLVNSSYYAIPGGVSDVGRAISFVGFSTLHQLLLSASVMEALKTPAGSTFDARGLWLHSLAVGSCADVLARDVGTTDPGACFTAGLLHDIGKIALAIAEPVRFGGALDAATSEGISMSQTEQRVGLPSHDAVGNRLAVRWKFPVTLSTPIRYHHDRGNPAVRSRLAPSILATLDVVTAANDLCRFFEIGASGSPAPEKPDLSYIVEMGMSHLAMDEIRTRLMKRLEASRVFLELVD